MSHISRNACCACETAIPYPGTIITFCALLIMKDASSALPCLTFPFGPPAAAAAAVSPSPPKPPSKTLTIDLFIPLHMI